MALTLFGRRDLLIYGPEAFLAGDNGSYAIFARGIFVGFVFHSLRSFERFLPDPSSVPENLNFKPLSGIFKHLGRFIARRLSWSKLL